MCFGHERHLVFTSSYKYFDFFDSIRNSIPKNLQLTMVDVKGHQDDTSAELDYLAQSIVGMDTLCNEHRRNWKL